MTSSRRLVDCGLSKLSGLSPQIAAVQLRMGKHLPVATDGPFANLHFAGERPTRFARVFRKRHDRAALPDLNRRVGHLCEVCRYSWSGVVSDGCSQLQAERGRKQQERCWQVQREMAELVARRPKQLSAVRGSGCLCNCADVPGVNKGPHFLARRAAVDQITPVAEATQVQRTYVHHRLKPLKLVVGTSSRRSSLISLSERSSISRLSFGSDESRLISGGAPVRDLVRVGVRQKPAPDMARFMCAFVPAG